MKLESNKEYVCRNGKKMRTGYDMYKFLPEAGSPNPTSMGSIHYVYGCGFEKNSLDQPYWCEGPYAGRVYNSQRCTGRPKEDMQDPWDVIFSVPAPEWEQFSLFEFQ